MSGLHRTFTVLSETDYRALLGAIGRLHAADDPAQFPMLLMRVVRELVGCEHLSYNDVSPETHRALSFFDSEDLGRGYMEYVPVFARHMDEHPLIAHVTAHDDLRVKKVTDFVPQGRFRELALYRDCYRFLDTEYQIVLPVLWNRARIVSLAINRKLSDSSERDRALLEHLRPHATLAFARTMERQRVLLAFGDAPEAAHGQLRELGLTARQAEVLYWVLQGKTNAEISIILRAKLRTIDKHLEHILRRLHVENRAACIVMVLRRFLSLPG